ncbi:hypothetical protein QJS10_CPA09g00980 [Acorus calamus]|uniref:Uncharacterized protein n=1 Tax=Acorus calamus TaxID=4465 RepID=A0AAV9E576_ACOCL|nr:hypothetical protein QJS10_CPA09g00980 [Acorus calamus]
MMLRRGLLFGRISDLYLTPVRSPHGFLEETSMKFGSAMKSWEGNMPILEGWLVSTIASLIVVFLICGLLGIISPGRTVKLKGSDVNWIESCGSSQVRTPMCTFLVKGELDRKRKVLELAQSALSEDPLNPSLISNVTHLKGQYLEVLKRDESFARQKSRQIWLKEGDKNSGFFHAKVKERDDCISPPPIPAATRLIDDDHKHLCHEVSIDEVKAALFSLKPLSSPGPDGFSCQLGHLILGRGRGFFPPGTGFNLSWGPPEAATVNSLIQEGVWRKPNRWPTEFDSVWEEIS